MCTGFHKLFALLCVLFYGTLRAEKHSLYYIYTGLSKPVNLPGIYQFTAMGLLDDKQIDYYNSKEQKKIPKQSWMKEKMQEDYWEKGTESRKSKEQWFNVNVAVLIKRINQSESALHALQWRTGCEVDQQGDELKFSKGVYEYSYDGENFLTFDDKESQWVTSAETAALRSKRKWNMIPKLNQYFKDYLEKECVDWIKKFREYEDEELRNGSRPDVYLFARKSVKDKTKLKLSCLATGFFHKNVTVIIRKYRTPLPEKETESTGFRPNHDGTFQMRKSVEIKEEEKAEYDCFVSHRTHITPTIIIWDGKCQNCPSKTVTGLIGAAVGSVVVLTVAFIVGFILWKKGDIVFSCTKNIEPDEDKSAQVPLQGKARACGTSDSSETSFTEQENQSAGNKRACGTSDSSETSFIEQEDPSDSSGENFRLTELFGPSLYKRTESEMKVDIKSTKEVLTQKDL